VASRLRVLATVVVVVACLAAASLPAQASSPIMVGSSQVQAGCGLLRSTTVPVDWYAPASDPVALVYLQHGFLGNKRQLRDAALAFAHAGYMVVVPTLSSVSITCGINSEALVRSLAGMLSDGALADSARQALGERAPSPPERVVLAGHSIGAAVVTLMASDPVLRPRVSLVVHLDAVESIPGFMHAALRQEADQSGPLRILQLTAPPSSLNASNSGPRVVSTFRSEGTFTPGTDGALVLSGTHCDPLGGFPFNVCGSTPGNQRAFFDLAVAGADEALGRSGQPFDHALRGLGPLVARTPRLSLA